jgi:hypothetical protein
LQKCAQIVFGMGTEQEMQMTDDRNSKLEEDIKFFVEQIKALNHETYVYYKPITEELCKGQASETEMEYVLDSIRENTGLLFLNEVTRR